MDISKNKIKKYKSYLQAIDKIIEKQGKEAVTIRSIAEELKCNSSLLYKYFDNLDHLLFLHSIGILTQYSKRLSNEVLTISDPLERFFGIWKLFLDESLKHPNEYYNLFFTNQSDSYNNLVSLYYQIFPEIIEETPQELIPMMLERHIYKRDYKALEVCANNGYLKKEDLAEINYIIMLIYQGALIRAKEGIMKYSPDSFLEKFIEYIRKIVEIYRIDK